MGRCIVFHSYFIRYEAGGGLQTIPLTDTTSTVSFLPSPVRAARGLARLCQGDKAAGNQVTPSHVCIVPETLTLSVSEFYKYQTFRTQVTFYIPIILKITTCAMIKLYPTIHNALKFGTDKHMSFIFIHQMTFISNTFYSPIKWVRACLLYLFL